MSAIWNLLEIKLIISIFQLLLVQVQALISWKNIFELKIARNEPGLQLLENFVVQMCLLRITLEKVKSIVP